jgi:hypothetical protein
MAAEPQVKQIFFVPSAFGIKSKPKEIVPEYQPFSTVL